MAYIEISGFALLTVLQALDVYTTNRALAIGARELNPVLAWLFARAGVLPVLITMKLVLLALVGAVWRWCPEPRLTIASLIAACAAYTLVAVHNFQQLETGES